MFISVPGEISLYRYVFDLIIWVNMINFNYDKYVTNVSATVHVYFCWGYRWKSYCSRESFITNNMGILKLNIAGTQSISIEKGMLTHLFLCVLYCCTLYANSGKLSFNNAKIQLVYHYFKNNQLFTNKP